MRYSGSVGISTMLEVSPGVWESHIAEKPIRGELLQRTETFVHGDAIHPEYRTTTSVSVLPPGENVDGYDDYVYVTLRGKRWTISSIVHEYPRLKIYIGEVYNGPTPPAPPGP